MSDKTTCDSARIWLPDALKTEQAGASLARTMHLAPITVLLRGDIGAGKTTFLRGFLRALGVTDDVTSPTYAIEQRYETETGLLLHIDLYRLSDAQSAEIVRDIDPDAAIVCVEWPERFEGTFEGSIVDIHLADAADGGAGRDLLVAFDPLPLPTDSLIEKWRNDVCLPEHIRAHCDTVAAIAVRCASELLRRGILVRTDLVRAAGKVHDLLKFVDFDGSQRHLFPEVSAQTQRVWSEWKERFEGMRHEAACSAFLEAEGFRELARVVRTHGATVDPLMPRRSIEEDILYYADKRVCGDKTVTLAERFDDFRIRYSDGVRTPFAQTLEEEAQRTERLLFPDGPAF